MSACLTVDEGDSDSSEESATQPTATDTVTNEDGSTTTTYSDGTKQTTTEDGTTTTTKPDGTTTVTNSDDSTSTANSDISNTDTQFSDNGDGTVTDKINGLVWMKCSQGQTYDPNDSTCAGSALKYSFCGTNDNQCNGGVDNGKLGSFIDEAVSQAYNTCESLNNKPYAGFSTWRVPTNEEIKTIVYCSNGVSTPLPDLTGCGGGDSPSINQKVFPNTMKAPYWSSSSKDELSAWFINFGAEGRNYDRTDVNLKANQYHVRCISSENNVTNNSSSNLPAPTNVTAEPGDNQITVKWNSVEGAMLYNIRWSNSKGISHLAEVNKKNINNLFYIHVGLATYSIFFLPDICS